MLNQLTLPTCCLPTCGAVVEVWGAACDPCVREWGPYLKAVERRPEVTDEDLAAAFESRRRDTMAAYAAQQTHIAQLAARAGVSL